MAKKAKELKLKDINKLFIDSVKKVAKALGKEPSEVAVAEFKANDPNSITEWDLRKAGGFNALKKMYFEAPLDGVEYKNGSQIISSFKNKLVKKFATSKFMKDEILSVLEDVLKQNPIKMHAPVKRSPKKSKSKPRTILAHLSDTHYGSNIDAKEMADVNNYNWTIAARRTALFVEQVAQYKPQYRDSTDLVLAVNGDLIAGVIHNQEFFADLIAVQFAGAVDIMVQAVSYLATKFKSVKVEWTTGNHSRMMHKGDKGRATTHKWDSYETIIGLAVKKIVEATHKNVDIVIPQTPFNIAEIHGHLFFITHGDTTFNVGNPGKALNMKDLNTQISKLNASELGGTGRKFSGVLVGHVHVPTIQMTESGCMLVINGCLSGLDPFASSIGIFESNPTQQLVEVTEEHAVGDVRLIQVKDADDNKSLDAIIKPFKGYTATHS